MSDLARSYAGGAPGRTRIGAALVVVLAVSLFLAYALGSGTIGFLRERLRSLCGFYRMGGDPGGWACLDGMSYVMPAMLIALAVSVPLFGAAMTIVLHRRVSRPRTVRRLAALALVAIALIVAIVTIALVPRNGFGAARPQVWGTDLTAAAVLCGVAVGLLVVVLVIASGRVVVLAGHMAVVALVTASVVQPGVLVGTLPAMLIAVIALWVAWPRRGPSLPGGR